MIVIIDIIDLVRIHGIIEFHDHVKVEEIHAPAVPSLCSLSEGARDQFDLFRGCN